MASKSSTQRAFSSPTPGWKYDVFLSFYGQDTRKGFTDHLYAGLTEKGLIVFRDDEKLDRGKYISEELLKAIEESFCAVVVISENYAFSKWCLNELAKIVECRENRRLKIVYPVFYHVDPSDVRKQKRRFAKAFARHGEDPEVDEEKKKTWRAALRDVAYTSGWHIDHNR
jgi:hypothetical protein